MKIKKLAPPVMDYQIVDKVNEIIELLNNSFITQDKDCAILDTAITSCFSDADFKMTDSHCRSIEE